MTQREAILKTLRGRKTPLTAQEISDKAGLPLNSTRVALHGLTAEGDVVLSGLRSSAIGRPSNLYLLP
jgi:predicted ArsR family transcriptional regulator